MTAAGVVRLAWAIPANLRTFQSAKVALIPADSSAAATLTFYVCPARSSQVVTANCAGPFSQGFTSVANQLVEIDMSAAIGAHLGAPGASYLSVLAYTTPTTATDHIVGLRFTYAAGPASLCFDDTNRYVNCGNGTVTDTVTGLIWLQESNCLGSAAWAEANQAAAGLASGTCGLTDGSSAGDWRVPTQAEWTATVAQAVALGCTGVNGPSLTNDAGTACLSAGGSSFAGVASGLYWSSTTRQSGPSLAWAASLSLGAVSYDVKGNAWRVWPVRGGPAR